VDNDIAEAFDVGPRNLGMALTKIRREVRDGLANDRQLVNHGAANQAVPFTPHR